MTEARYDYYSFLDNDRLAHRTVTGYRGFAKTTGLGIYCTRRLAFQNVRFLVWVSRTQDHAVPRTESIKTALLTNRKLRRYFGSIKPVPYDGLNPAFNKFAFHLADETTNEVYAVVVPKGADQQMNGLLINIGGEEVRPDLFVLDDVIDRKQVRSAKYRRQMHEFLYDHLMPCVEEDRPEANGMWPKPKTMAGWKPPYNILWADTIKIGHDDPFHAVRNSAGWYSKTYPKAVYDDKRQEWRSTIPTIVSHEQIQAEASQAERDGRMDGWVREYACMPRWTMGKEYWHDGLYRYYAEAEYALNNENYRRFMIVDPSRTTNARSAFTACLPVAVDEAKDDVFFRPMYHKKVGYVEQPFEILAHAWQYRTPDIAVESTGDEDGLLHRLREAARVMASKGICPPDYFRFIVLDARKYGKKLAEDEDEDIDDDKKAAKRARALEALPLYRGRHVLHEVSYRGEALERQQKAFPEPGGWDALDVSGYVRPVMRKIGIVIALRLEELQGVKPHRLPKFEDDTERMMQDWAREVSANAYH